MPTLGEWVLNSLDGIDAAAGQAGPRSPGRGDAARAASGTPASVRQLPTHRALSVTTSQS